MTVEGQFTHLTPGLEEAVTLEWCMERMYQVQFTCNFTIQGVSPDQFYLLFFTKGRGVQYSLYAVSNHSGTTYGGHYTAFCKHPFSNEWHCFNDSRYVKDFSLHFLK